MFLITVFLKTQINILFIYEWLFVSIEREIIAFRFVTYDNSNSFVDYKMSEDYERSQFPTAKGYIFKLFVLSDEQSKT